jgi:hypothetical protein
MKPIAKESKIIEWLFSDKDEYATLGRTIITQIQQVGVVRISTLLLIANTEYIPKSICENKNKLENDLDCDIPSIEIIFDISNPKPNEENYGWVKSEGFDNEPSGWVVPEGEEMYTHALKRWESKNQQLEELLKNIIENNK